MFERKNSLIAKYLWEEKSSLWLLLFAAALVTLFFLGTKTLWTQEWRWAAIPQTMLVNHDFLHPYLQGNYYYDKPLLSYWFILALSWIFHQLNLWAIRLPSAIAGLLTVWSVYRIGLKLSSRQMGLLAGWMLISTYCFVFWARVSSADILNVAGIMLTLMWYFDHRDQPSLFNYIIFFLILSVACQFKGIVAAAIVLLVLIPELLVNQNWKKHLNFSFFLAMIPGLIVYFFPFWLSSHFNAVHYEQSGLYEVFQENIVRFIHPFDHKGPIYLYFIYFPIFIFPWIILFFPALFSLPKRWREMSTNSRWMAWALLIVFLFFTASGSRRYYYVLSMVPFAILFVADWLNQKIQSSLKWNKFTAFTITIFYALNFLIFVVAMPIAYSGGGLNTFAKSVRQKAKQIRPWNTWTITLKDTQDKAGFYFNSPNPIRYSDNISLQQLVKYNASNNILVIGEELLPQLKNKNQFLIVQYQPTYWEKINQSHPKDAPVALIPEK